MNLFNRAKSPSVLILINILSQSAIRFVSNILLAQLLLPAAFALTAITTLITTGLHMVSDIGIVVMTLRNGEPTQAVIDRMWTLKLVRGWVLAVILVVIAVPVASIYQMPVLIGLFQALSIGAIIQEGQSLYPVVQIGRGNLVPSFFLDVGGRAFGAVVAVGVAILTPTVWSLIAGIIGQALFATVLSHILSGKLPKFVLDVKFIRAQWGFARWIQMSSSFTFVASQIDRIVFPFLYGFTAFGIYGIGAAFALIPAQATQKWSASVFYPLTVQRMRTGEAAKAQLRDVRMTMMLYSIVVAVLIILIAPSFFYLLYKPTYHEAARFAQLLTAAFFFEMTESTLRQFLLVDATPRFEFIAVVVRVSVFIALVSMIWAAGGEATLYALAYTGAQASSYLFMLVICTKRDYVKAKADLSLAGLLGTVILAAYLFPFAPRSPLAAVGICAVAGLAAMALIGQIYRRRGVPSLPQQAPPASIVEAAEGEVLV